MLNARGTEAKMAALGYQISGAGPQVPDKSDQDRARASKIGDSSSKPLHSKFHDTDTSAWPHGSNRKESAASDAFGRSNSFDDYGHSRPQQLLRTQTDSSLNPNAREDNGFSMDVSSIYEDNESPALSPALNNHLALRPLNTQTSAPQMHDESAKPIKQRRRSRSATHESSNDYYGSDPWENYRKEPSSTATTRRKESSQHRSPEDSSTIQTMRDRQQRSPTPLQHRVSLPSIFDPRCVH